MDIEFAILIQQEIERIVLKTGFSYPEVLSLILGR